MVVRQVIIPVTIGLGLGIAGAVALTRVFASLLYEVKPTDPVTFVAVSVIALIAAFLSSYFPGLRAARIDPIIMLRCE
jgi:putative ABC transport system permease protein